MTNVIPTGAVLAAVATIVTPIAAQAPTTQELLNRINAQDRRIAELTQSVNDQGTGKQSASGQSFQTPKGLPLTASYDGGFCLRSTDAESPFELRVNGRMQFRYVGYHSDDDSTNGGPFAANTPTSDRNDFEIERGRLEFRGTFFDPNTHFYINLDADTDDNHRVIFHDFWVNYDVAENHSIYVGKAFFVGSRDWLNGSTRTHLVDRSLATTFFRPDRTVGVWAIGKLADDVNYRVMVGNGLITTDLTQSQVDQNFAYGGSVWWDPLARYGRGPADLEHHEELALRIGTTVSHTKFDDIEPAIAPTQPAGGAFPEGRGIFLSNGSRVNATSLNTSDFDFLMGAADAALKYKGFSVNGEAYWRQIDNVETPAGPAARDTYYSWGGYVDAGLFLVKQRFEPVLRFSTVQGLRDSYEYAAGFNYYPAGTHQNKLSVDVSKLDGSPTSNSGPNYRVGDDGWMFRIQWQIAF